MINVGALNLFDSFIKKLVKSIGLYQVGGLHLCGRIILGVTSFHLFLLGLVHNSVGYHLNYFKTL